jgi:DNA gyrase subunit A
MELLDIDEMQAVAILDMQLRRLAALERQRILDELAEREREIADLQAILADPARQRRIIGEELARSSSATATSDARASSPSRAT